MKNTSKILALVLIVMTVLMSLTAITASAADQPETLYLTPSANWKQSNARFAAYFFGNGEKWVSMTDSNGDGIYEVAVPTDKVYPSVIFCRMNPNASANNWNNKWNQTSDLTIPTSGANHYTVKEGTWDKGGGTWSTFGSSCLHTNLGPEATCTTPQECLDCGDPVVSALGHTYDATHLCTRCNGQATFTVAGSGAHLGTEWDTGNTANDMTYADGVYTKVYTNVTAGSYKFKVARDHDWGTAYPASDKTYQVTTSGSTVTITLTGETVNVEVEAPVHEHSWSDATCTEAQKCECGATQGEALGHDIVADEAVAPTCTATGLKAGEHCSRCDYKVAQEEVAALGHDIVADEAVAPTCTATGLKAGEHCSRCDYKVAQEEVAALGHSFAEGVCSVCGAADPDYKPTPVIPVPENPYLINFSTWPEFAKETFADGDTFKLNDVFTFIWGKNSRIDGSAKTWDDLTATLRFSFGGKTPTGSVPSKNALQITVDGAYTIKVWYVAGGDARYFALMDAEGTVLSETTKETTKNSQYFAEIAIPAAGTYYLGVPEDNNYIFQIELVKGEAPHEHNFVDGECECGELDASYVNTLVVGDTNKIIVNGDTLNDYQLPIEWVAFVADEKAHYEFVGNNSALCFIFDMEGNLLCLGTGKADLEAGTYLICVGNGATGAINVAVTKSEIVVPDEPVHENKIVIGENNKIVVDGTSVNGNGNPIAWVPFVVEEKALYTFASETENALVYIFNSDYSMPGGALTSTAVLEPGTYIICVGNGVVGDIYVTVTKEEVPTECEHVYAYMNCTLCGEANPYFAHNLVTNGENKIVCNQYHLVDTTGHGNPYQFTLMTVTEDGLYRVSCSDKILGITIYTTEINSEGADFTPGTGASWGTYTITGEAELKAGTYYIGYIFVSGEGEYTVNVEKVVHEHEFVDGKCECGESDPNHVPEQPPVDEPTEEPSAKPGLFDAIIAFIKKILALIMKLFKF